MKILAFYAGFDGEGIRYTPPITRRLTRTRRARSVILFLAVVGAYVAAGKVGLSLASLHPSASPVWPPTGVALAVLLLLGPRLWPAVLIGAFIVNVTTAGSVVTSAVIAGGNTLEALVGWYLLQRFAGGARAFEKVGGVLIFVAVVLFSTMVSATMGVGALVAGGLVARASVPTVWFTWWLGDAVGALVVAPVLVLWGRRAGIRRDVRRTAEALSLLLTILLIGVAVFSDVLFTDLVQRSLVYLSLLPVLWAGIRFGPRETSAATVLLSCLAIVGAVFGQGPFAADSSNTSLLLLQSFMGIVSVTGLMLAAALAEMRGLRATLERTVQERTGELEQARKHDSANLQRLRDMISRMPIAAVVADEQLQILQTNERFREFFGLENDDAVRALPEVFVQARSLFLDPSDSGALLQLLAGRTQELQRELHLKDGTILSCDYVPIADAGVHRGHLLLCRDVTEERRVDRAKSEFMSLASHQLRTPLTNIRWALNKLDTLLAGRIGEREASLITAGRRASERMCETVETMLSIAQIESGQYGLASSRVALRSFLQDIAAMHGEHMQASGLSLAVECDESLAVRTDAMCLKEIVSNLLSNAAKYTPSGGRITVHAREEGDEVRIDVADTGIGIPPGEQHHIFHKFFRAQNARELNQNGTGLGLYLSQTAALLLGAQLSFVSDEGVGTCFTLTLPTGKSGDDSMGASVDVPDAAVASTTAE